MKIVEKEFHGSKISFETNRIAKQSTGSVIVRSGESVVLVTACRGDERDVDFLPLSVDYVEKMYAAGKIPGGFFKREGRLSESEILNCRIIDRPIRPLFPKGMTYDIQVVATVLSADPEIDNGVLSLCGASAALTLSDLPFEGPVAAVRVGRVDGEFAINPNFSDLEYSDINFLVAGTKDAIVMVEGGAEQVPEDEVLDALFFAHQELQFIIQMQEELAEGIAKPKVEFTPVEHDAALVKQIEDFATSKIQEAVKVQSKQDRKDALKEVKEALKEELITDETEDPETIERTISATYDNLHHDIARSLVFDSGHRLDGRDSTTVRPIDIDVGVLPRAHGSSLFTRGETQAIVVATLGTEQEAQRIDSLAGETKKHFMLHYNFPPFSVGEVRPMRGPGRREIGHGALAERAVQAVVPEQRDFPYVIRVVSEITESNGSSSMATVCGASLALMDAGVPLKAPVAGIAMGLMKQDDSCAILTDILGDEDHLGDMDFKVCGTENGITALQMDIKIKGLDRDIMIQALEQAKEARLHILGKMNETIESGRAKLSKYAPKIVSLKVESDQIKDVIGPGGKTIRSITESCEVKVDIDDTGKVTIAGTDQKQIDAAIQIIESLTARAEVGKIYKGVVKRIADFGAFVEILPGTDGLLHISQISEERIRRVTDVVNEGDEVMVKVLDVDRHGKIRLSMKEAQQGAEA